MGHIAAVLTLPVDKDISWASSDSSVCPEEESDPDRGELIFFKVTTYSVRQSQNPITSISLHQLTLGERFPQSVAVAITAPSCWSELALTQRQRRQPAFQSGPGGFVYGSSSGTSSHCNSSDGCNSGMVEDGLYSKIARVFRLQQDKFRWDDYFFKISLPPGAGPLAHVHLRFILFLSCTVPPEIQVTIILDSI